MARIRPLRVSPLLSLSVSAPREWPEDEGSTIEGKERMDVDLSVSVEEDLAKQTEQILGDDKK